MSSIRSVSNALKVLQGFTELSDDVGVSEMARHMELSTSVVYRLLVTMREQGFVEQDPETRKYRVGPAALEVGQLYLRRHSFAERATKAIQERMPEHTSFVGVLADGRVLILAATEGTGPVKVGVRPGERRHLHATALGKAFLAQFDAAEVLQLLPNSPLPKLTAHTVDNVEDLLQSLQKVREQGYAVNDEETVMGVVSVGAVIRDVFERPIGAISISVPKSMVTSREIARLGLTLAEIAASL